MNEQDPFLRVAEALTAARAFGVAAGLREAAERVAEVRRCAVASGTSFETLNDLDALHSDLVSLSVAAMP